MKYRKYDPGRTLRRLAGVLKARKQGDYSDAQALKIIERVVREERHDLDRREAS